MPCATRSSHASEPIEPISSGAPFEPAWSPSPRWLGGFLLGFVLLFTVDSRRAGDLEATLITRRDANYS